MPYFSIFTPTHNPRYLLRAAESLAAQTFKDFEVVVSDQSTFDNLRSITDTFSHVLNINYVRNTSDKKNAANNVKIGRAHV